MDYVEWCDALLSSLVEKIKDDLTARSLGIYTEHILDLIETQKSQESNLELKHTIVFSLMDFEIVGFLESDRQRIWKVLKAAKDYLADKVNFWERVCSIDLEIEHKQLLQIVNEQAVKSGVDWITLGFVPSENLEAALNWSGGFSQIEVIANELENEGLVKIHGWIGGFEVRPTFLGQIWQTRGDFTLASKQIDALVFEWETTTVDFKRELYLDTADQKAEFVKDVLSLVNTKSSGLRWMIIGFDDSTHKYYGPPSSKLNQNRMEQILNQYAKPSVTIKYEVINYRQGQVGRLQVIREVQKIPFAVAKSLGEKKRIFEDQIFVRHGSQVEPPTPSELTALKEEGERARSIIVPNE